MADFRKCGILSKFLQGHMLCYCSLQQLTPEFLSYVLPQKAVATVDLSSLEYEIPFLEPSHVKLFTVWGP